MNPDTLKDVPTRDVWTALKSEMPDILTRFYESVAATPELQKILDRTGSHSEDLKSAQIKHWEFLFQNELDLAFQGRAIRVGEAHIRVGLPMRWYIASYGRLLNEAIPVLIGKNRLSAKRMTALIQTLISRIFIDMIHANEAFERGTLENERRKQTEELSLNNLGNLASTTHQINAITMSMAHLSRNTTMAADGAQTISSAIDQLATSVREISERSTNAAADAEETSSSAAAGLQAMRQVAGAIAKISSTSEGSAGSLNELNEASEQIGDFLSVIQNIADQTNLLALNATIEAARAGEAGKGFAVVASEVKSLAQQSARATDDISNRISLLKSGVAAIQSTMSESRQSVLEGEDAISKANDLIEQMDGQISAVTDRMQQISEILNQQMEASQEIAVRVGDVAHLTSENDTRLTHVSEILQSCNDEFTASAQDWFAPESPISLCEMAKIDHIMFKKQIVDAVTGHAETKSKDVPDHHNCRLGKWYDKIEIDPIRDHPAFSALAEPHQQVHEAAKRALKAIEAGEDHRESAFEALIDLDKASEEVLVQLNALSNAFKNELAGAEKRNFVRTLVDDRIQIEIDDEIRDVTVVDVSSGGLGINGAKPEDEGKTIRIFGEKGTQLGEIVWVSATRAGVRFLSSAEEVSD